MEMDTETVWQIVDTLMDDKYNKIDLLNGGYLQLVDCMGSDLSVVRSARVSYNADWRGEAIPDEILTKDEKLIHYLKKNHHTSPFESVVFTFEVQLPIFVVRQWHRHRTWSYNEVSGRYTELDMGWYVPDVEQITTQSTSNKQMRTTEQHPLARTIAAVIDKHCEDSFRVYKHLLDIGTPRELARGVLPLNAYTRMFATVDLHNLFHYLKLRLHEHSQYEIRVYAEAILKLIEPIVPVCVQAFKEHG